MHDSLLVYDNIVFPVRLLSYNGRHTEITAGAAQWVRALVPQAGGWVFESQPRQIQVVKEVGTAPHNRCECLGSLEMIITNVCHSRCSLNAQLPWVPSLGQNLKPFTGKGDASIWMKNSWVGRKTQTNKQNFFLNIFYIFLEGFNPLENCALIWRHRHCDNGLQHFPMLGTHGHWAVGVL